jgi:hypothetical protein
MRTKASKLREDLYSILDRVLETGVPAQIERRCKLLEIVCVKPPSKLGRLKPRDYLRTAPEELVHLDWLGE